MIDILATLVAGAVIVLGIVGTVVPLLPGSLLVMAGVVLYAILINEPIAWAGAGVAVVVLVLGMVGKWLIPAKKVSGQVDNFPIIVGGICAVIGFFVIPVVGILVGFIVGVLGTELVRTRSWHRAWPATKTAIHAAGLSLLIELTSVVLAGCVWLATILALVVF